MTKSQSFNNHGIMVGNIHTHMQQFNSHYPREFGTAGPFHTKICAIV